MEGKEPERFGTFVAYAVIASGFLAVCLGRAAEELRIGYLPCSVGFSGVLYAMSIVLTNSADSRGYVYVEGVGIAVPRRWALYAEMVLGSLFSFRVSLLGHLGGVVAGRIWCSVVKL